MAIGLDVSRLEALLESAKLLQSTLELDLILKHLLRSVMGRLLARRGIIAVRKRGGEMKIELARGASQLAVGSVYSEESAREAGIDRFFRIGTGNEATGNEATGILGIGGVMSPREEEVEFVEALLGVAASVISNAEAHDQAKLANSALDQRLQELRALLDLGRGLAATLDPDEVAKLVGLTVSGRWAVSKYAVVASKPDHVPIGREKGIDLPDLEPIRERLSALPEALVSGPQDAELLSLLRAPEGALLIPMRSKQQLIGLIVAGPRMRGMKYREADLEFGAGLAAQAAVAFENAWHFQDTLARQQLEKELSVAAGIQRDLFPKSLPKLARLDIAARNRQAKQVGGDYYDVLPFAGNGPEDPHLLCVADIAGKGVSAALLMSTIQATLRTLLRRESSLIEIAGVTNELLYATTPANKFATAFLCAIQPATGRCKYVNCAHNVAVLLRADDTVEQLDGPGLALGLFPMRTHKEAEFELRAGDILAIYSDGVSEAQNMAGDEFGLDRLTGCMQVNRDAPASVIVDHIFDAIDAFAGEAPQFDDITLMILKRE